MEMMCGAGAATIHTCIGQPQSTSPRGREEGGGSRHYYIRPREREVNNPYLRVWFETNCSKQQLLGRETS